MTPVRSFIRSLEIDAYVVGGAVRDELLGRPHKDEDFLVPGVDQAGLRALLEPHGSVADLEVHGQLVGVRLYPHDKSLAPAGIEIVPPRAERSTGPGHRDFAIISDASITIEEDMSRRDFTINAMARRLSDGTLVDPFGGESDIRRRQIRTVGPTSFGDDPLRIVRALRFISQLGFYLALETEYQMRDASPGLANVSAERIGGGIEADGMGELSKLLLGQKPDEAIGVAILTGAWQHIAPEIAGRRFRTVLKNAADDLANLPVRLASLFCESDAATADLILGRLRYPNRIRIQVVKMVQQRGCFGNEPISELRARKALALYGEDLSLDIISAARALTNTRTEIEKLDHLRDLVLQEAPKPHRISDLEINGDDLKELGYPEGPLIGRALHVLLHEVVEDPGKNTASWLRTRAGEALRG